MPDNETWTTKDGCIIKIEDLDTDHLKAIIIMLRDNGMITPNELAFAMAHPPQGEYAQLAWEEEQKHLRPSRKLELLENELARRIGNAH